ncbi:MAG: hypothetical protein WCA85_01415 [Paraburkholderia sp.]
MDRQSGGVQPWVFKRADHTGAGRIVLTVVSWRMGCSGVVGWVGVTGITS